MFYINSHNGKINETVAAYENYSAAKASLMDLLLSDKNIYYYITERCTLAWEAAHKGNAK